MSKSLANPTLTRLVEQLGKLPGIGKRSAERIAFHLLKQPGEVVNDLAQAIGELKTHVHHCSQCFNLTQTDPCPICSDPDRDRSCILVVEQPNDVINIETLGMYQGLYHVLMGRLAPLDDIGPGELNIDALLTRIDRQQVREVILGMNPNLEGDATALYLAQRLTDKGVNVTRLARGLPTGSSLETVSKAVLADAILARQVVDG